MCCSVTPRTSESGQRTVRKTSRDLLKYSLEAQCKGKPMLDDVGLHCLRRYVFQVPHHSEVSMIVKDVKYRILAHMNYIYEQ